MICLRSVVLRWTDLRSIKLLQ